MTTEQEALAVVAYSPGYHLVSCAIYDPSPGHCDCGSTEEPLVKLADAQAMLRKLVAEREADRAAMREALEALKYHTEQTRPIVATQVAIHHLRQRLEGAT